MWSNYESGAIREYQFLMCYHGVSPECFPGLGGLSHCVRGCKQSHSKFRAPVRWKRQENALRNLLSADPIHSRRHLSCVLTLLHSRGGQSRKLPFGMAQPGCSPASGLWSQPWQQQGLRERLQPGDGSWAGLPPQARHPRSKCGCCSSLRKFLAISLALDLFW